MKLVDKDDVVEQFARLDLDEEAATYVRFHAPRFAYLVNYLQRIAERRPDEQLRILDIGPSFQTTLFKTYLPNCLIDTLGYKDKYVTYREGEQHHHFDLNDAQSEDLHVKLDTYDAIVFAEVIEHLHTSPRLVLNFLNKALKPKGVLILQTPNAVAVHKRVKLAMGKNPYELINEDLGNPGHFREYTTQELEDYCKQAGFEIAELSIHNYFNPESSIFHKLYRRSQPFLPKSLREGITIMAEKQE